MIHFNQVPTIGASTIKKLLNIDFYKDLTDTRYFDETIFTFNCSDDVVDQVVNEICYYEATNNTEELRKAQNVFALLNLFRAYGHNDRVFILTAE